MHKSCGGEVRIMRSRIDRVTCWLQCLRCGKAWL